MNETKAVANYFLELAERDGTHLTPMKLQKLVYFAHGWSLAIDDTPLIRDTVEAWQFGPVIPTLYHEFKRFGSGDITGRALRPYMPDHNSVRFIEETVTDTKTQELLDQVWSVYGKYTGIQLSNLTHASGTPWEKIYSGAKGRKNVDIPDLVIKEYFTELLHESAK